MSDEKLVWEFNFDIDKGGDVRRGSADLAKFAHSLESAKTSMLRLEGAGKTLMVNLGQFPQRLKTAADNCRGFNDSLLTMAKGIGVAVAALAGAGYMLDKFGTKAVQAFGERQASLRAYTTLLGDAKQAQLEYSKAQQLALRTDLTAGATQGAQKSLMVAGFRGEQLDQGLLAGLDIASMAENKDETLKRFAATLGQVRSKGKLQSEELLQFAEGTGLGTGLVKDELMKSMGLKDRAGVEKALQGGQVSADVGVAAIERAVMAQLGTSKLGEFATGASGSLTGLISNRDESIDILLKQINAEVLPAMSGYKESLTGLNDSMSLGTESGQNLSLVLQDLSNSSMGLQTAFTEFLTGFIEVFGATYTAAMTDGTESIESMSSTARSFGEWLGEAGSYMAKLNDGIALVADTFKMLGIAMGDFWWALKNPAKYLAGGEKGDSWGNGSAEHPLLRLKRERDTSEQDQAAKEQSRVARMGIFSAFADFDRTKPSQAGGGTAGAAAKAMAKKAAGSKGHGLEGYHLGAWDYAGGGGSWMSGASSLAEMTGKMVDDADKAGKAPDLKATLHGDIHIHVDGTGDPAAVGRAVDDALARRLGRLARTARPGV